MGRNLFPVCVVYSAFLLTLLCFLIQRALPFLLSLHLAKTVGTEVENEILDLCTLIYRTPVDFRGSGYVSALPEHFLLFVRWKTVSEVFSGFLGKTESWALGWHQPVQITTCH